MRAFPELMVMIQGMAAASRSVSSTLVLLVITLYAAGFLLHPGVGGPFLQTSGSERDCGISAADFLWSEQVQ